MLIKKFESGVEMWVFKCDICKEIQKSIDLTKESSLRYFYLAYQIRVTKGRNVTLENELCESCNKKVEEFISSIVKEDK